MSARLYLPTRTSVRIRPDFTKRPVRIRLPRDKRPATIILASICLWGAIGTVGTFKLLTGMIENSSGVDIMTPFLIAFVITAGVLLLGWRALRLYLVEDLIVIDNERVNVTRSRLLPDKKIALPLESFKGLRSSHRDIKRGDRTLTYHIIELVHDDPDMDLPLFVDRESRLPPGLINKLSSTLNRPIIEDAETA